MLKIVIDTNVLVSGLYNKNGVPAKALNVFYRDAAIPVVTHEILKEYIRVINYEKFGLSSEDREAAIHFMSRKIQNDPDHIFDISGIPDDDLKFVSAALEHNADGLITGNGRHFQPVSNIIRIYTPAEFISEFGNSL